MTGGLDRILVHRHVLRAADDEVVDAAKCHSLVDPLLARPRRVVTLELRHPDPSAAGAAAKRVVTAPGHLHELSADRSEHLPRLVVDAVVTAERAGVMVRDPVVEGLLR